ncbi:hypothetical protein O181_080169 [Austropuccinia psidii MF-1]|uniref:Uncharacterized protein n=1 Tax=Austropuccinia psidii MF-1 TaxID=1389203 RepID=A0A9Q3FKC9_9BASI|nr:hypothetical protein [Austropuccinia psidii MF-1]
MVRTCSWWPNRRNNVSEYFHTGDRCQKENRYTGKKFGIMIQLQETKAPWEAVHMDYVTALPPGRHRKFNAFLVLVDKCSKSPIFIQCHKDDTAMDTVMIIWNRAIRHTDLLQNM